MTAAKEDVQVEMNDAFAVMQRAAKGKAKAITQPEQVTVTELPWYVIASYVLGLLTLTVTDFACKKGRKVQTDNARRGRIPQRHHLDK